MGRKRQRVQQYFVHCCIVPLHLSPTGWGGRSPTHTLLMVGESAIMVAHRALDQQLQRFTYTMSYLGFADANPLLLDALNAVALELQCWCQNTPFINTLHGKPGNASWP
jgi:hypothetical protein